MSYYSDVVLGVKDGTEIPDLYLLEHCNRTYVLDGYRYFIWYCIKWYDHASDVHAVEKWLDTLNEDDYYMKGTGEEEGDVWSRGWDHDSQIWVGIIQPEPPSLEEPTMPYKVVIGFLVVLVLILL